MSSRKTKRSAFLMSAAAVLAFSATDAIVNLVIPYLVSRDIHTILAEPQVLENPGSLIGLVILLFVLLGLLIAVGAFWVYRFFGEPYYGKRSLFRWMLFGFLFAVMLEIPKLLIPSGARILIGIFQFLGLFIAFFTARWIIPLRSRSPSA